MFMRACVYRGVRYRQGRTLVCSCSSPPSSPSLDILLSVFATSNLYKTLRSYLPLLPCVHYPPVSYYLSLGSFCFPPLSRFFYFTSSPLFPVSSRPPFHGLFVILSCYFLSVQFYNQVLLYLSSPYLL